MFVRGSWLWCVRRSLAGLKSVFGDTFQNAKQLFFNRILQMTKYFVMRECEDIPTGISLCYDSGFAHKKKKIIFEFLERFLEISCRDLTIFTTFALFAALFATLII
jgi:hypothetical protein